MIWYDHLQTIWWWWWRYDDYDHDDDDDDEMRYEHDPDIWLKKWGNI